MFTWLPKIKEKNTWSDKQVPEGAHQPGPSLFGIRVEHHFEGAGCIQNSRWEPNETEYQAASSEFQIKKEDVIAKGAMAYVENPQRCSRRNEKTKRRATFCWEDEGSKLTKTGNVVNGKGQPFSFELFVEMIKKIWIDFDEMASQ